MAPYLLYAGGYEGRILTLSFDPSALKAEERLKVVGEVECGAAPTWLTFSQDGASLAIVGCSRKLTVVVAGKHLYAADEWGQDEGTLAALSVSDEGVLKNLSTVRTGASIQPLPPLSTLTPSSSHRRTVALSLLPLPLEPSSDRHNQLQRRLYPFYCPFSPRRPRPDRLLPPLRPRYRLSSWTYRMAARASAPSRCAP